MKLDEPVQQGTSEEFLVGGVKLARPFRIRRLGHFGVNVMEPEVTREFYCRLLGFRVADPVDHGNRLPEEQRKGIGPTVGYFTRHGTDHHSLVFFPRRLREALNEHARRPSGTINQIMRDGIAPTTGWRATEAGDETYDVGGVLLARPFKVVRVGPVRVFVNDMEQALAFYRDELGLTVTEEVTWRGQRCVFLRANTEHHSLALYPVSLRAQLDLNPTTTLFSFGLQVGSYSQLREAVEYLKGKGATIKYLPPELSPGIDYCAFVLDPDGYALQLYYYMEQVGWDGKPRPASLRPKIDDAHWPEWVVGASDAYLGEPYLGPLG